MVRCIVFSQSSVPSRNSEADEPDEPDEADEAETMSATAAPTRPVIAPGQGITVVSKQTPSNYHTEPTRFKKNMRALVFFITKNRVFLRTK